MLWTKLGCLAVFSIAVMVAIGPTDLAAQMAVAATERGSWSVRSGSSERGARIDAVNACQTRFGQRCQVVGSCSNKGHGAVARGRTADGRVVFGTACAEDSEGQAISRAVNRCRFNSGTNCTVENDWYDEPQQPRPVQVGPPAPGPAAPTEPADQQLSTLSLRQLATFQSNTASGSFETAALGALIDQLTGGQQQDPNASVLDRLSAGVSSLQADLESISDTQREAKIDEALSYRSTHRQLGNSHDEEFWLNVARTLGYVGN